MFELNKYLEDLDIKDTTIKTSLVGAGSMGSGMVDQINQSPGMEIDIVVDLKIENAINALTGAGTSESEIAVCDSIEDAEKAFKDGKKICSTNSEIAWSIKPIQVVIEATGTPTAYAHIVLNAIRHKKHVVTFWRQMSIVDTKPFMLPVIRHSIFVQRPPVRGSHGLITGVAFDRIFQYTR